MVRDFREIFESRFTWIEGFMRNVRRYAHRKAMIDPETEREWTYEELNEDANRLSNALVSVGFKQGDILMVQLLNSPEFAFSYVSAHKLASVCCPVNYRLSPGELAQNIEDAKPAVVICNASKKEEVLTAIRISGHSPLRVVVVGGGSDDQTVSYEDFVKRSSTNEPQVSGYSIYNETTRLFTSGTTGRAKGVPLTSVNEVLSAHDIMIHFPMNYTDVTMNTTPWFHRGGLHCAGPCPTFYAGATLVIMGRFDAKKTLKFVCEYGITFIVGVPTVLEALADEQERQGMDISSLKGIVTMGSPLERSACIRYQKVLTPNIFNGYGTTETLWNTFLRPQDLPAGAGTAGASCVDDDVRVVKVYENRRAEPDDLIAMDGTEVGEVIISSPAKSPFVYSDLPEETERKYYGGFIYTNDLATWNENQFITIVGRKDDMIISSGENIYPTEIEAVLNNHPGVKDCIVTSVPDKVRGQIVTAYIVRQNPNLTPEELDQYCMDSPDIANFKRPRYYRFTELIPFNATGKKLHVKIKEQAEKDLKNGLLYRV